MLLPLSCAVLTTFAALADAQGFHDTIVRPEPALNSLNRPGAIPDLKLDNSFRETTFRPESTVISTQSTVSPQSVSSEQPVSSSSVTIQVTPPPEDDSHHTEVHHPHHTDPTPNPPFTSETNTVTTQIPPPMVIRGGERYPQTRTRPITEEEATTMNYAELRYAINEMYARHGADFSKAAITRRFLKDLAGYRPRIGVSLDDIEKEFNQFEYANGQVLAKHKNDRWARGER